MFGLVPGGDESASRGSSTSMNWMKNLKGRSLTSDCSDITDNFRGSTTEQKKPKPPGNPKSSTAGVFPTPPPTSNPNGATLSTVQQFGNVTNFKQYRSTRPALLEELNAILNSRLQKDAVTDDARMHNFQVYREAFQRFIDDFNIYKQFLTSVKHEYDSHIEKFAYEIRTVTALRTELATKEQEYGMLLRTVERAQEHKMVDIDNEKRALEKSLKEQAAVLKNLQLDNVRLTSAATKAIKDFEELRATCNTLTNSLSRLEAERRVNQATQAAKVHEFIALKSTAQKSLDEIDRLRHDKHDLEAMQSQMVSQDVVTEHQVTIDNLRSEIKTKELTHKDLIYRYSLLKQTIDMTWSQHVPAAVKNKDKERNANAAPNAKAPSFKQQTEEELKKLKDLGNHTSSARVLVETLLNQIIDLQKTNNESNPSSVGGSNSFGNANAAHNIDGK
jgi:DNA repair exonuclease SbcCD ATPase subunit